jgi:hypothetical protein
LGAAALGAAAFLVAFLIYLFLPDIRCRDPYRSHYDLCINSDIKQSQGKSDYPPVSLG